MELRQKIQGLDWLIEELEASLERAAESLEAYLVDTTDEARIQTCLTNIGQVHGSLMVVDCQGPQILSEEMKLLAEQLVVGETSSTAESGDVLMEAILRLPAYVRDVIVTGHDQPETLLALLNEMRAVRGQEFASEGAFFSPQLTATPLTSAVYEPIQEAVGLENLLRKLRQVYQFSMLGVIKGEKLQYHFSNLEKVFIRLQELSSGSANAVLWLVSRAFLENLSEKTVPVGTAVKVLLRELDSQIKQLLHHGGSAFRELPPTNLLQNLLFYVALGACEKPNSRQVSELFCLGEALPKRVSATPSRGVTANFQPEIAETIVSALVAELAETREKIERYADHGYREPALLAEASALIQRMSDSLTVVGATELRNKLDTARQKLGDSISGEASPRQQLVDVAEKLLEVEAGLQCWPQGEQAGQKGASANEVFSPNVTLARKTLCKEALKGLESIKEAIVEFIASQWNRTQLQGIPPLINEVAGALEMLSLVRARAILGNCSQYLSEQFLEGGAVPDWNSLDKLAEVMTCVEYYLESTDGEATEADDTILVLAEQNIADLGYPVEVDLEIVTAGDEDPLPEAPSISSEPLVDDEQASLQNEVLSDTADDVASTNNDDAFDAEIIQVFIEEAEEVLADINNNYSSWSRQPEDQQMLEEIRRSFHTLKGSGRMVGAEHIGELSWVIENLLNRVLANQLKINADIVQLVVESVGEIPAMVAEFEAGTGAAKSPRVEQLIECAERFTRGEVFDLSAELVAKAELAQPLAADIEVNVQNESEEVVEATVDPQLMEHVVAITNDCEPLESATNPAVVSSSSTSTEGIADEVQPEAEELPETDNELIEIFVTEAEGHLATLAAFVAEQQQEAPLYTPPTSEVQRALHTLKGSALMVGVESIAELVVPLEKFVKKRFEFELPVSADVVTLLVFAVEILQGSLPPLKRGELTELVELPEFLDRLNSLDSLNIESQQQLPDHRVEGINPQPLQDLMVHGLKHLMDADRILEDWQEAPTENAGLKLLADELEELCSASAKGGNGMVENTARQLATVYQHLLENKAEQAEKFIEPLLSGHDAILNMLDSVVCQQPCAPLDEAVSKQLLALTEQPADEVFTVLSLAEADIDGDILQTFIEEADDLLESMDQALNGWSDDPANAEHPQLLKRYLHTLKGGGRMAGLVQLGDLSHQFEDDVEALVIAGKLPQSDDFASFEQQQTHLIKVLQAAREYLANDVTAAPETPPEVSEIEQPNALLEIAQAVKDRALATEKSKPLGGAKPRVVRQEMIKVAAPKLENLVNLAGETSIARGRVEQQVSAFGGTLQEMDSTISRLHDQVRRLSVETDAQVLFRKEQMDASMSEGFDPLEMDRYSHLQQLARSLLESASDLRDLKETLTNKARGVESQLIKQGRINTELQESMMQTRMVPFSRMVPRLRRMIRQLSTELDKRVQLKVDHVEGEMDRTVMENVLAPMEHLLRNALDHGIETVAQRQQQGKPDEGTITIGMKREGGDILIRISDDGRGLDLEAIRQRAISLGMVDSETVLEDQEIIQFIFMSGFTTADSVSQVSGRGVGMDVANSQIRQLGGVIETRTNPGEGVRFSIRLPFTVSINRALMVLAGEETYAIPLNSIDGVIRVNPAELEHYYRHPDSCLEHGGGRYQVRHLCSLLNENQLPRLDLDRSSVALVLVHSETRLFAIQVDGLLDSDEIVVKSLGAQFSSVSGLAGATIRGDGSVVVILDVLALLRVSIKVAAGVQLLGEGHLEALPDSNHSERTILVVDDSVTVRKVTKRFLTREGFRVLTAKDGVDALQLLQDHRPDAILLDIEMPRMDGFEVASRLRNNPEKSQIPVIMITSRTGEKHRQRAHSLGVKKYLGKPYQEDNLLESLNEVLANADGNPNG